MSWLRRLAVAFIVLLTWQAVAAAAPPKDRPGGGGGTTWKYTALGDSLATGFGARKGYVPRYKDYLANDNGVSVDLKNLGQNGWTSANLLNALQTDGNMQRYVAAADVVTWDIGGNDLRNARAKYIDGTCGGGDNQDCLRTAVADFKANWTEIVKTILALRSGAPTILRTMDIYNPYVDADKKAGRFDVLKVYIDDVNGFIAAKESMGYLMADVYVTFNGAKGDLQPPRDWLSLDGFHPSDKGHEQIALQFREEQYSPLK